MSGDEDRLDLSKLRDPAYAAAIEFVFGDGVPKGTEISDVAESASEPEESMHAAAAAE